MLPRAHLADAIRWWEIGRVAYNLVLALVVLPVAFATGENWRAWLRLAPTLLALGVLANLLYCAAYPADLILQRWATGGALRYSRLALWGMGALISGVLAAAVTFGTAPFSAMIAD
jgi:hypothetical protein